MQFGVLIVCNGDLTLEAEGVVVDPLCEAISAYFIGSKIISKGVFNECNDIKSQLIGWCNSGCDVIITQGCTSFAFQDISPEVTKPVRKETLGLVNVMISESLVETKMAMLTHPVCQIIQETLIVHLPGDSRCVVDCFDLIKNTLEPAVALIKDSKDIKSTLHNGPAKKKRRFSTKTSSEVEIGTPSKVKKSVAYRQKKSYPVLEVKDACDIIIKEVYPSHEIEVIPYEESLNKVLAEDIYAHEDMPPFPVSMKDGYAVKSSDKQPIRIVRQIVTAEDKPCQEKLKSGEAWRVCTGAPIPPGADAVIEEEETSFLERCLDGKAKIFINRTVHAGEHIKTTGSHFKANSLVLNKFDVITSKHLGILETIDTEVKVFKQPSIAVISTGNEVKSPRKNNKIMLMDRLKKYYFSSDDCGVIKDDPNIIKRVFEQAFSNHDVVITSGDAFTAEFDILKEVLIEDFSALIHFQKVNMKPGDSTIFATLKYNGNVKVFFGLPGNAHSCTVALIIFVIPTLRFMQRCKNYKFPEGRFSVNELSRSSVRPEYTMLNAIIDNNQLQFRKVDEGNCYVNNMVQGNCLASVSKNTSSLYYEDYGGFDIIFFDSVLAS